MSGRLLRSTRGRVAIVTLITFSLIGLLLFTVLDFTSIIDRVQALREAVLLDEESSRIATELETTGSVEPRDGQVRTIVVPTGSVAGLDPFDSEVEADGLLSTTDLSPQGLDPALFDSKIVFYPILEQQGWRVFQRRDGNFEPISTDPVVVLSAVTDDAVIGPLSVREALLLAIPVGSIILAAAFAVVAGTGLRPVRRMTTEAGEIEIDDLERRLPDPRTGDELSDLAETINGMLDRVRHGVATERRFVADAAHELRSPIAASTALLEVSLGTDDLDWKVTAMSVLDEQRRLGALVDDLVLLARLDDAGRVAKRFDTVSLDDVVVAEVTRPFATEIEVMAIEPIDVVGDPASLVRVVRNLLSNADRHASDRVEVRLERRASDCLLHIDDDGSGVPAAERQRVFDRFARLDDARARDAGGSGIGLAIVKQVVELSGGTVEVTDAPLGGARFTVTLPLRAPLG